MSWTKRPVRRTPGTFLAIFLALLVSVVGAYVLLARDRIFADPGALIVYGSARCAYTTALRGELDARGVSYSYADTGVPPVALEMFAKLGSFTGGGSTAARLPVVQIDGEVLQRPDTARVLALVEALRNP